MITVSDFVSIFHTPETKTHLFATDKLRITALKLCQSKGQRSSALLQRIHNAEKYTEIWEKHTLPSRRQLFQGSSCIFEQDNKTVKPHCAHVTKAWLRKSRMIPTREYVEHIETPNVTTKTPHHCTP